MAHYIMQDEQGIITAAADWQFDGSVVSERPVVRGYDGALYFDGAAPNPPQPAPLALRRIEIQRELDAIDLQSVRPLRAKLAGTATAEDEARLTSLETQAQTLRTELAGMQQG